MSQIQRIYQLLCDSLQPACHLGRVVALFVALRFQSRDLVGRCLAPATSGMCPEKCRPEDNRMLKIQVLLGVMCYFTYGMDTDGNPNLRSIKAHYIDNSNTNAGG